MTRPYSTKDVGDGWVGVYFEANLLVDSFRCGAIALDFAHGMNRDHAERLAAEAASKPIMDRHGFDRKGPGHMTTGLSCNCRWHSSRYGDICPEHGQTGVPLVQGDWNVLATEAVSEPAPKESRGGGYCSRCSGEYCDTHGLARCECDMADRHAKEPCPLLMPREPQPAPDPTTLTAAEVNAALHTLISPPWDESRCRVCGWPLAKSREEGCARDGNFDDCSQRPLPERRADAAPDYCSDAMRRTLLAEIGKRGLEVPFIEGLLFMIPSSLERTDSHQWLWRGTSKDLWHLLAASSAQIVRAALAALQEGKP